MSGIAACALPANALLERYVERGAFTDCFKTDLDQDIKFPSYVIAFYTTSLFRKERFILKWLVKRPSSDEDVRRLAAGEVSEFAAWSVEDRSENQLLLCDMHGRTRSWLMAAPDAGRPGHTVLYFGSAVVPRRAPAGGTPKMGAGFFSLKGFHTWYSKALLAAARTRLIERQE
jgi:hypothetical protein